MDGAKVMLEEKVEQFAEKTFRAGAEKIKKGAFKALGVEKLIPTEGEDANNVDDGGNPGGDGDASNDYCY